MFDRKYHLRAPLVGATSNPADGSHSHGGVARNVAENLARLGVPVLFSSIVGEDETGAALVKHLDGLGVDTAGVMRTKERPTAEYAAILDPDNELAFGIADMAIFERYGLDDLEHIWAKASLAEWLFADCNLPAPVLAELIDRCRAEGRKLAINTVSAPKAVRLADRLRDIDLIFTNRDEAAALLGISKPPPSATAAEMLAGAGVQAAIITDGAAGYHLIESGGVSRYQAVPAQPVDITGAGDAFIAGTLSRLLAGDGLAQAASAGALLAARTTETLASVLPDLSPAFFDGPGDPARTQG